MRSKNHVNFRGHVGKEPEIRPLNDGRECAVLALAMTDKWKDRESGEPREHTEWARIVAFREDLVNVIKRFVKKGSGIEIEGKFTTRKFNDNTGAERYTTEIILDGPKADLALLTDPKNNAGAQPDDQQPGPNGTGQGQRGDGVRGDQGQRSDRGYGNGNANGQTQRTDRGGPEGARDSQQGAGRNNRNGSQSGGQQRGQGRGAQPSGDDRWSSIPF